MPIGQYKIVDQGKEFIAGYTNEKKLVNILSSPIIIFGDHTKIFKYIDFPLALGADGAKALTIKNNLADSKYLYYYFRTLKLTDAGYSRHFKFLKEVSIPLPEEFDDQIRIATVLNRAEKLIAKRKESIKALDELLKSIFQEMFGNPVINEKGWQLSPLGKKLSIKHGFAFQGEYFSNTGEYVLLTPGNFFEEGGYRDRGDKQKYYRGEIPHEYLLNKGDLLVAMTEQAPGLLGSSLIVAKSNKFLHNQRLGLIIFEEDDLNRLYLFHLFNHPNIRRLIHSKATGTKVRHTSPTKIAEIKVSLPPLLLQNQFAAIVEKVEVLKSKYTQSLTEMEDLYGSLSQRAFKGELDLGGVQVETEEQVIALHGEVLGASLDSGELFVSKIYSEAELIKLIKSLKGKIFSYDTLMTELEKASFEEIPKYEELKEHIYKMLKVPNPLLSQTFDKIKKEIVLRVNI